MHQGPLENMFNQIASPPPTHLRISGLMNGGGGALRGEGAEILHFSEFPIAAAENLRGFPVNWEMNVFMPSDRKCPHYSEV